jgi:hypothetical protein
MCGHFVNAQRISTDCCNAGHHCQAASRHTMCVLWMPSESNFRCLLCFVQRGRYASRCQSYDRPIDHASQQFDCIVKAYCKGRIGERYVERGDYHLLRASDNQDVARESLARAVEPGTVLEMSMILQWPSLMVTNKICPRCRHSNSSAPIITAGWLQWQVPHHRIAMFIFIMQSMAVIGARVCSRSTVRTEGTLGSIRRKMTPSVVKRVMKRYS